MRRRQVCPGGERKQRPVIGVPAAALLLTAAMTLLLVGACTTRDRPAWERAAVDTPASAGSRAPAAGTNAVPRLAPPVRSGGQATTGRIAVERVTLPPPGAASGTPAAASGANAPQATASGSAKSAKTAPVVSTPANASVAHAAAAGAAPSGAPGKAVAVASAKAGAAPVKAASTSTPIDPAWIGYETYVTRYEDTLIELAVKHNQGFIELAMANRNVDPWLPGEGTTIVLPNMHLPPDAPSQGLVLNLPEQRLYSYEKGKLIRSYPIGIGRDGHATPVGSTTIVRKSVDPVWYPTPTARADDPTLPAAMSAGPDNPLGSRAMYLGWSSYLIHGTNKEFGIGRRASRGCIRMYSDDIIALYKKTPIGTRVTVVDQPIKVGWIGEDLFVEASPTMEQVRQWEEKGKFDPVDPAAAKQRVLKVAGGAADRIDWSVFERAVSERRGIPTRITRPTAPALATASTPNAPSGEAASTASKSTSASASVSGDLVEWLRDRLGGGGGH